VDWCLEVGLAVPAFRQLRPVLGRRFCPSGLNGHSRSAATSPRGDGGVEYGGVRLAAFSLLLDCVMGAGTLARCLPRGVAEHGDTACLNVVRGCAAEAVMRRVSFREQLAQPERIRGVRVREVPCLVIVGCRWGHGLFGQ
jgi:hypothetical protein